MFYINLNQIIIIMIIMLYITNIFIYILTKNFNNINSINEEYEDNINKNLIHILINY